MTRFISLIELFTSSHVVGSLMITIEFGFSIKLQHLAENHTIIEFKMLFRLIMFPSSFQQPRDSRSPLIDSSLFIVLHFALQSGLYRIRLQARSLYRPSIPSLMNCDRTMFFRCLIKQTLNSPMCPKIFTKWQKVAYMTEALLMEKTNTISHKLYS
jgi:hypothetical protein